MNPFAKNPDIPNIVDTINRSGEVAAFQLKNIVLANQPPHVYIHPPIEKYSMLDYKLFDEIMEVGYQYALSHMETWKEQLDLPSQNGLDLEH